MNHVEAAKMTKLENRVNLLESENIELQKSKVTLINNVIEKNRQISVKLKDTLENLIKLETKLKKLYASNGYVMIIVNDEIIRIETLINNLERGM